MIGDPLHYKPHHFKKAEKIINYLAKFQKFPIIITIAGESGTGKSEIADIIQRRLFELNIRAYVISCDDYYKSSPGKRKEIRQKTGVISHKELYWKKIKKIMRGFKKHKSKVYIQRYNLFSDSLEHTRINTTKLDVLIFEGLYAGYLDKTDLKIYLDSTHDDTYKFRKKRKKENPDDNWRKHVLKIEGEEVRKTKQHADVIIPFNLSD